MSMLSENQYYELSEFGKYIYYVGIFYIIALFTGIAWLGLLIALILALQRIKNINKNLQNPLLNEFYVKLLMAQIIFLIGNLILFVIIIDIIARAGQASINSILTTLWIGIIIGMVIQVIGSIVSYQAWGKFLTFLLRTRIFPPNISSKATDCVEKLRTACIFSAIGFIIITQCLAAIYYVIGYLGLGDTFKDRTALRRKKPVRKSKPSIGPREIQTLKTPKSSKTSTITNKICPYCGSSLTESFKFCPVCGNLLESEE